MPSMRNRLRAAIIAAGAAAAIAWTVMPAAGQQAPAAGLFPAYRAPHMADGHPDLNGIWQAFVSADWDLQDHEAQSGPHPEVMGAYGAGPAGLSVVEGGTIPYQLWALQKKKDNFEKRATADVADDSKWHQLGDPEFKCYMPGVPRA